MAAFEQFGDSSHNLALYAFLPDLGSRVSVLSELHTEIAQRFAVAGIDIPNPQFDLYPHRVSGVSRESVVRA
jgi:small-conductance mechanosensitive channel